MILLTMPPLPKLPAVDEWLHNTKEGLFSRRSATLKELDRALLTYQQCHNTYTHRCQVYYQYFDKDWFSHVGAGLTPAAADFNRAAEAFCKVVDSLAAWKQQSRHASRTVHGAATALERTLHGGKELIETGQEIIRRGITPPSNPFELKTGTAIPSILVNDLNSDPSVELIAQVSQPVYDTASGSHLLIPRGARIFGRCDSRDRMLVVWQRLAYPLIPGDPGEGDNTRFVERVDNYNDRICRIFVWGQLTSMLCAEYDFSQPPQNNLRALPVDEQIASTAVGQQMVRPGTETAGHSIRAPAIIGIRKGCPLDLIVNKNIVFDRSYRL
jgi:hypothetical protein